MAKQIGDLTTLAAIANDDLFLIRDSDIGIDTKMTAIEMLKELDREVRAETGDITVLNSWRNPILIHTCGGLDRQVSLPALATSLGMLITVIKIDSAAGRSLTNPDGVEAINGEQSAALKYQYERITYVNATTQWVVLERTPNSQHRIGERSAGFTLADDEDNTILMTAAADETMVLPLLSVSRGRIIYAIKVDSGSGNFIIDGSGAETINGQTTLTLPNQYDWAILQGGPNEWHALVVAANTSLKTITASETLDSFDRVVLCNHTSAITVTLATAAAKGAGNDYLIKRINSGLVTVDGNGSETIDGELDWILSLNDTIHIESDGTNYHIV